MVINTNLAAMNSANLLAASTAQLNSSIQKLSSGSKINSPADDAAGLAVSMRFQAQINRIDASTNNVANATSYVQTQDGLLQNVQKALDRMSELSVLAQDSTKTTSDLTLYDKEFQTLKGYIQDVAKRDFNGVSLFNNTPRSVVTDGTTFLMSGVALAAGAKYTALNNLNITTSANAATTLTKVKAAIQQLATDRAQLGANETRLSSMNDQLGVTKDTLTAANSQLTDVDVAQESTNFARYNILVQAGTAMLAQANASTQSALRLLQ